MLSVCKPLDELLNGGLEEGCITNFFGPPGTAKTQVALQACISAVNNGKKVVFIDTEGGFSLARLTQIVDDPKKYTDNIILLEPKDWSEQGESIRKVNEVKNSIGLVIVDSVVALWRIAIHDENATEVNRELAEQLSILSRIAREKKIPVLVTNHVYSDFETGKIELSSRNIVKWWSKNLIELIHLGPGKRMARISKARSLPEGKSVEFEITEKGLE